MMSSSSFSRQQRLAALAAALATALASWVYFGGSATGIIVSGAGDAAANGYYLWDRGQVYRKVSEGPAGAWRVPNVYDWVLRGPQQYRPDRGEPEYFVDSQNDHQGQGRVWNLNRSGTVVYRNGPTGVELRVNTPPSSGWVSVPGDKGDTQGAGIDPPPQMEACGRRVSPDPDPQQLFNNRGGSGAFALGSGPAEMAQYPVSVLLVAVNLIIAYHLWAKRVPCETVAISYSLFWEEREYWRIITASFSHFEPLHLLFNAMSTWNTRETERLLGSFRHLYLSLDLVVTTILLVMVVKHFLIKWGGMESHRRGMAVGFSCVIFAYMTYLAVAMREFCPVGRSFSTLCFKTWYMPMLGGLPPLPVNLGPFGSLALAQMIMPKAGFLGHLAGIFMGYLMSWGMLGRLSTPILAGASVVLMLQHSKGWARNMPDFSLLLQGWAGGDSGRVARARRLNSVFAAHVCLTVAFLFLFSWGTGVAEMMALVVGFNAVRALKCCCCPDSVPAEHRFCINLLKAYGTLSAVLLVSDLISFGFILRQSCFLESSGLSGTSLKWGLGLLVLAAAVHVSALAGCIEGIVIFRDGQAFLSSIGLGKVVTTYAVRNSTGSSLGSSSGANTTSRSASRSTSASTSTLPYAAAAGITAGRHYRGGGRVLGTVASNRSTQANVGRGGGGRGAATAAATAASNRAALPGYHV